MVEDENTTVKRLPIEEIAKFTHFIQQIIHGGELVVSIRISNSIKNTSALVIDSIKQKIYCKFLTTVAENVTSEECTSMFNKHPVQL